MNRILKRIEKLETLTERLEQSIVEIRNSCPCLAEDIDEGEFNCEPPTCEKCGQFNCVCGEEYIEEDSEEPEKEPVDIDIEEESIEDKDHD